MPIETSEDYDMLVVGVANALDAAGFQHAVLAGPATCSGYSIMKLNRAALAVTVQSIGNKDKNAYSARIEYALAKAGFELARPFFDAAVLRVSRKK